MNTTDFMQMSHANCAMQASDMSYEIETLRRPLAEKDAEIVTLRQQKDAMWFAAAESQALLVSAPAFPPSAEVYADWMERVAECRAKSNDTALREMIAKAGEVTKERCAVKVKQLYGNRASSYVDSEIHALPGVTLEDLK